MRRFSRNSNSDHQKPTSPVNESRRDSILIHGESKADPTKALREEEPAGTSIVNHTKQLLTFAQQRSFTKAPLCRR